MCSYTRIRLNKRSLIPWITNTSLCRVYRSLGLLEQKQTYIPRHALGTSEGAFFVCLIGWSMQTHASIHLCTYIHIYINIYRCIYMCTYTKKNIYMCICIFIYVYIYTSVQKREALSVSLVRKKRPSRGRSPHNPSISLQPH